MQELVVIDQAKSSQGSVFDAHHPPAPELIDQCVHCGFCLPTCPTYLLWNEEMDSPRGRVYLMKMGAEGGAKMDEKFVSHFDRCLGCMACMTACPSGVQYGKLIEATRAQIERNYRRPFWDRLYRWLIFSAFPHPRRLRLLTLPLWLYQKSGLRWLMRKTGLIRTLPEPLRAMESLLPEINIRAVFARQPRSISQRHAAPRRVGVLLGCVQRTFFGEVNRATVRVLAALGCDVVVPETQGCCGALMAHTGREDEALDAARRMIEVFERAGVDTIVVNSAGCGSNMKEYGHLLRDDPAFAARAQEFSSKCRDVSEFIADVGDFSRAKFHVPALENISGATPIKVAYHDSCHLQHAQGIRVQPRELLKRIPGLELIELPEAAICCGSAGVYNLLEPEPARQLADRKAQHIIGSGAEALVSANPGCLLHINSALKRAGKPLPVFHVIEVIDAALRAELPQKRESRHQNAA